MDNDIWKIQDDFKRLCISNPVYPDCEFVKKFIDALPDLLIKIESGKILYRARAFSNNYFNITYPDMSNHSKSIEEIKYVGYIINKQFDDKEKEYKNGFWGYNAKDSFINPVIKNISEGRCNRQYEQCLYCADSIKTAISELRPMREERISVAEIKVKQPLNLIDVSLIPESDNEFIKTVAMLFLSSPIENNYDIYKCSQVICSIVKKQGYDGIKYSSCQTLIGSNYAIFNYKKCKPVSSKLYDVNYVNVNYEEIKANPTGQNNLAEKYKQSKKYKEVL